MKIRTETREARCPACGTWINTTGLPRRRKVQCPKCREVVDLSTCEVNTVEAAPAATGERTERTEPAEPVPGAALAEELADLRVRVARLELLEARILELERALESAKLGAPPVRETPPESTRKLRWLPQADALQDAGFNEESADFLIHNLSVVRPHVISIRSLAGDPAARDRALCFKDLFERGNWRVRGPWDTHAPIGERGLIIAVRTFPVPEEVTAAFIALTASGFSVISRLDPNLESDEAMLIVA
jgi:phage FluMu protein Com